MEDVMFASDIAPIINQMVDTMLRGGHTVDHEKKVLFITLKLEVAKDRDAEATLRRYVNFMYYAPARYVLVGSQESDWAGVEDHHNWFYRSRHDSCWRYDGTERVLNDAYFKMCKSAFPNVAPIKLYTTAEICGLQFREIQHVDPNRPDGMIYLEF